MWILRPSWLIVFWAAAYATIFFPFQYQPVHPILPRELSFGLLTGFLVTALVVRQLEAYGLSDRLLMSDTESWKAPKWLAQLGMGSLIVSLGLLILIAVIVLTSGQTTIQGWEAAVAQAFPSFGRILLHLKQIALPVFILTTRMPKWRAGSVLAIYLAGSIVYSFSMGERVFFLETLVLIFSSAILRGWIKVSVAKVAMLGVLAVFFFMLVENAKQFIFSAEQEGQLLQNASLVSPRLIERFLAYYADPSAKMEFVLSERMYFEDALWFRDSVGIYLERLGLDLDVPAGVNPSYWSSGHGGPILTNSGGFTSLLLDFGPLFFLPLLLLLAGMIYVYRRALHRSVLFAVAYCILILAAVEMPRVAYIYWARFWFPLAVLGITYCVAWVVASRFAILNAHAGHRPERQPETQSI